MYDEKIMNKIKNLLDLSNNNPNENEAIAAALKAQELMAKYDIEVTELEDDLPEREIAKETYFENAKSHSVKTWKYTLARTVAKNFRCKYYILDKKHIVFYGYKEDAKIALEVFTYLYKTGNKLANRYYNKCRKERQNTKGVLNTYLLGFCEGVKSALDVQCTALMIVVPKEVNEAYNDMVKSKNFGTFRPKMSTLGTDNMAYSEGKIDGKAAANGRQLAG